MGLNDTVSAERIHIGFYGMRNAGKSSVVNAVTSQKLSLVSDVKGTTTDPVKKAMELLPLGPVVILDTPGLDDEGELGKMRVERAMQMLSKTDIAVIVVDSAIGKGELDISLENELKKRNIPFIVAYNKLDLGVRKTELSENEICVSALTGEGIDALKAMLGRFAKQMPQKKLLVSDLISRGDVVVLVTPIDESAPKGRIILPQQLVLRDVLDSHAMAIVCQTDELAEALEKLSTPPKIVITDSQVFGKVSAIVPENVPLTSFSIVMARYKGELDSQIKGFNALKGLRDGDRVLICEGCTHHRQCNDIGSVKMPMWIENYAKVKIDFSFSSGGDFPPDLSEYALIVHCGGCMLNEAEMKSRVQRANEAGVPIVNYGIAIAGMHGILERSIAPFGNVN